MRTRRILTHARRLRALRPFSVFSVSMFSILIFVVFATPVHAQDSSAEALSAAGCGPANITFEAKGDKNEHPTATPDAGKAMVYLIGNTAGDNAKLVVGADIVRIGIDGTWVAANALGSYVYFQVDPGDHRLCINYQAVIKAQSKYFTAMSFTAVAGQSYYFRTMSPPDPPPGEQVVIAPMDPAEALVLIAKAKHTTWQQKK